MPESSPADELRTAAATVRAAATAAQEASPTPWTPDDPTDPELRWIALMDPTVGPALAAWLEHASTRYDPAADIQVTDRSHEVALAVARAINGPTPPADPDHGAPAGAGVCDRCHQWDAQPDRFTGCPQCGQPWNRRTPKETIR